MKRIHAVVKGKVQGVWFRARTREEAMKLGLKGWVRNKGLNEVEIVAEGPDDKLKELVEYCKKGPEFAEVEDVLVDEEEPTGEFVNFFIKY